MRVVLSYAVLLVIGCNSAYADIAPKIVVVERGIYRAETVERPDPLHDITALASVRNARLVSSTTIVPGRKGIRFGLRYIVEGKPRGAMAKIRLVTRFPEAGLKDPGRQKVFFSTEHFTTKTVGAVSYRDYQLDQEWEVVAGLWTFEFWHENRKIGEQKFCVVEEGGEKDGAEGSSSCAEELLS